jgi:hypothetical protein
VLFSHGPTKTFLIPDPCRSMVWNGNNVSADVTEDTLENNYNDPALLNEICSSFGLFNITG